MTVHPTDQWLIETNFHPVLLCKKITKEAKELHHHLTLHGMYRHPTQVSRDWITHLREREIWKWISQAEKKLQKQWDGPNISIYIFPADSTNRELKQQHHGKAGIAFKKKIFLFVSETNSMKEILALFTHEYHHVCRLWHDKKQVEEYVLSDTIILEGLAEYVVRKKFGPSYASSWSSYYSIEETKEIYRKYIYPHKNVAITEPKHQHILYGFPPYPKMAGYAVGYHLVQQYQKQHQKNPIELLKTPTKLMLIDPDKT